MSDPRGLVSARTDQQVSGECSGSSTLTCGTAPGKQYRLARPFLLWLFIAATLVYVFTSGSNFSSGDSYSELHVTDSLLSHRGFDVPVQAKGVSCAGWGCRGVDGRFYATHAIGNSVFMIPFYGVANAVTREAGAPNCDDPFWSRCVPVHLISWNTNVLTAATLALIALFGLELGYGLSTAVAAALLYGFASMAWPYARYGFDVTLTGLLVLACVREVAPTLHRGPDAGNWLRAGVWCGLAILVRLPTAIVVLPLAVICFLQQPRDSEKPDRAHRGVRGAAPGRRWYHCLV